MRVLIISFWYKPEPVHKPHDLAKELVIRGHEVTVITGFPNYPKGVIYPEYNLGLFKIEIIDGVKVIRIPFFVDRSLSVIKRIFSYLSFSLMALIAGISLIKRHDLIWTYQLGLPGFLLSIVRRMPLVHEVQDLWPEWGMNIPGGIKKWLFHILNKQEILIYKKAVRIITISNGFKRVLNSKGVDIAKIEVIPNWADENYFYPSEKDEELAKKEGLGKRFCIMYVGNIGVAQGLDNVIYAADLLREREDIEFVFIGEGTEKVRLVNLVKKLNLYNVKFLGYKPPSLIAKYTAGADVLLIHLKDNPAYEITVPSKTLAYLALGKPILAACKGESASLIKNLNAGITCEPGRPEELANVIKYFFSLDKKAIDDFGRTAREAFIKYFSKNILVDKYEEVFGEIFKNG